MSSEDNNPIRPFTGFPFAFTNNVSVGNTLTEIVLTFAIGTIPTNVMYMSLPVAKNLSKVLNNVLSEYEKKMGQEIMSVEEIFQKQTQAESNDKNDNNEE